MSRDAVNLIRLRLTITKAMTIDVQIQRISHVTTGIEYSPLAGVQGIHFVEFGSAPLT